MSAVLSPTSQVAHDVATTADQKARWARNQHDAAVREILGNLAYACSEAGWALVDSEGPWPERRTAYLDAVSAARADAVEQIGALS